MEKRKAKRHARRLRVRFGEKGAEAFPFSGFTHDISASGMFVVTSHLLKPGTRVHCEVLVSNEKPMFLEGVVARQVIVPAELRQVVRCGLGMRFLQSTELISELVPSVATHGAVTRDDPFCLCFQERTDWREAYEREFKRGGAWVIAKEGVPADTIVTVTFDLRFLKKQLVFEARVLRQEAWPDGRTAHALAFLEPAEAVSALHSTFIA